MSILNINCKSIHAKKESFELLITKVQPDIIIGTESWLKASDTNQGCFPVHDYDIERRDRPNDPHGGVFIASRKDLTLQREPELETDCEIVWCKLSLPESKSMHLAAYYMPHTNDEGSMDQLEASLERIGNRGENILLAGDFNLPGWDWQNKQLKPACKYPYIHHRFGELLDDHNLTQIVDEPTRGKNTLDLVATNSPAKINRVKIIPGISDHDCPLVEIDITPIRRTQKPRKIPLYKKARWDSFSQELITLKDEIKSQASTSSANQLWERFRDAIEAGTARHIPTKMCKKKKSLPYLTLEEIRKLIHTIKKKKKK